MALFEMSRPVVANTSVGARISNLFTAFVGAVVSWNDRRATRAALSKLSDHELDDLGLTRADVETM